MRKSNKILAVVLALVMILGTVPMMTAGAAKHEHLYEQQSRKNATCAVDGSIVFKCECGDEKTVVLKALGHDFTGSIKKKDNNVHTQFCDSCRTLVETAHEFEVEGKITTEPTCTKGGKQTMKCNDCAATTTVDIPANGHLYEEDATKVGTKHEGYCTVCKKEKSEAHVWEDVEEAEVVLEPTCKKSGKMEYECLVCEATKTESIPAEHDFGEWEVTADGKYHTRKCTVDGCKKTEKIAHNFVCEISEASTCEDEGTLTITCFVDEDEDGETECPYEKDEKIALGDHKFTSYEKDYTALKHKGLDCKVCGKDEAAKHDYVEDASKAKAATCAAEGEKTFKCACGKTKTEKIAKLEHKWGEWKVTKEATATAEGEKVRECSVCKTKETAKIDKLGATVVGDVNGDGKVGAIDARLVLQHIANTANPALTKEQIAAADIVGDGDGVKASDARRILEIVAGK